MKEYGGFYLKFEKILEVTGNDIIRCCADGIYVKREGTTKFIYYCGYNWGDAENRKEKTEHELKR